MGRVRKLVSLLWWLRLVSRVMVFLMCDVLGSVLWLLRCVGSWVSVVLSSVRLMVVLLFRCCLLVCSYCYNWLWLILVVVVFFIRWWIGM